MLFLILLLILLIIICNINHEPYYEGLINISPIYEHHDENIYLWTYWQKVNTDKIPDYIQLCLDIMEKNSKKYFKFILLNENTIFNYLPDLRRDINSLPIALKCDYIRVALLYRYGGLWVDADSIMMNECQKIYDLLKNGMDYIGFGCTAKKCLDFQGYGRPSNGVMGSQRQGKLITGCLRNLNEKLDRYYKEENKKKFDYYDLGKKTIWEELDKLKNYEYYHFPTYADGTRDNEGKWIVRELIFDKDIDLSENELLIVMLANNIYCGADKKYNWFCKLSREEILNGNYYISRLFRKSLKSIG